MAEQQVVGERDAGESKAEGEQLQRPGRVERAGQDPGQVEREKRDRNEHRKENHRNGVGARPGQCATFGERPSGRRSKNRGE